MDLGLADKVVFIAGSSRGIGLAMARTFVREGAKVVLTGRTPESLREAYSTVAKEAEEKRVISIQGDMTDEQAIRQALDRTVSSLGGIDIVVANVGNGSVRGGWDIDEGEWLHVLKENLLGSVLLCSSALRYMTDRKGGNIVLISSIVGCEATPAPVTYAAAKAALNSAMKNLSRLAGPQGIRINAVAPGNILFPGGAWEKKLAERPDYFKQYIEKEVPLNRFGCPEEIAEVVVFLASEKASFITGSCIKVDGGQTVSL